MAADEERRAGGKRFQKSEDFKVWKVAGGATGIFPTGSFAAAARAEDHRKQNWYKGSSYEEYLADQPQN